MSYNVQLRSRSHTFRRQRNGIALVWKISEVNKLFNHVYIVVLHTPLQPEGRRKESAASMSNSDVTVNRRKPEQRTI